MQARKGNKGKKTPTSSRRAAQMKKRRASAPRGKAAVTQASANAAWRASLPFVFIHRDTYQDFHLDDSKGYVVNFRFVPVGKGGRAITKTHNFTYYNSKAEFGGLPVGTYKVSGEAVYKGRKFPVHVGSEDGSSTDPTGGNFAPTASLQVKWGKDQWGARCLQTTPELLNVRAIE